MSEMMLEPFLDPETKAKRIRHEDLVLGWYVGEGSRGKVYKATLHGKLVAAKEFHGAILRGDKAEEYLAREVMNQARAKHPAILPLLHFIDDRCNPVLVTEFIPGGSLDDVFCERASKGKWKIGWWPSRVMACLCGAASALGYLHRNNIIHRDVKPANILLGNPPPRPLLADFGCSREISGDYLQSFSRTGVGSYFFLAPEIDGGHYTEKVDVYAWATTAYLLLTGEKWVTLDSEERHTVGILNGIPPPDSLNRVPEMKFRELIQQGCRPVKTDAIPEPVWKLITRCWDHDPNKRPSCSEILAIIKENPDEYSMANNARQIADFRAYVAGLTID